MARRGRLDASVPLPPGFDAAAVRRAVDFIEKELRDFVDIYIEQANVFSAIVGILGIKAIESFSSYERHRHADIAQQRFPDLKRRGSGPVPRPEECLESKASKRPWAIQSHYDHPGWYVVWRYLVDPTETVQPGRPVVIWRVDMVYLGKDAWKYEGSKAGASGGGRTHTFGVKNPASVLRGKAVYQRSDIVIRDGKPIPKNGDAE